jgi:hypothetical protein
LTTEPPVAAVVLATLAAPADPGLDDLLGAGSAGGLRNAMAARARRWAAAVAPGRAYEANTAGAAIAALHGHTGPVLLAAPDVPGLDVRHAEIALGDLSAGALAAIAPATDATPFLLGFAHAEPELIELAGAAFEALAQRIYAGEGILGLLRSERRLVTPADARALAADPVAPEELLAFLRGHLTVRRMSQS